MNRDFTDKKAIFVLKKKFVHKQVSPEKKNPAQAVGKIKNSFKLKIPLPPPPPHHFFNGPSLNEHNMVKNPNWREADQLAIYKHDRGVELGSKEKQLQLSGQSGTWTRDLQISSPAEALTTRPRCPYISGFTTHYLFCCRYSE